MLDTNVLISAFVFPGDAPEHVYMRALEGRITLITSRPLLSEFGRVLTEEFSWETTYAEEVVTQLVRVAVVVDPTEQIADITDDPADNRVLEAAAAGDVEVIVSGDRASAHPRRLARDPRPDAIKRSSTSSSTVPTRR